MPVFAGGLGLVVLVLWVYCLVDSITSDADAVRNLPKPLWVLIVLLLPTIGSLGWLLLGRPQGPRTQPGGLPYKGNRGAVGGGAGRDRWPSRSAGFPEYERPGYAPPAGPDDDALFQERLRKRVEEQRRRAAPPAAGTGDQERPEGDPAEG